MSKPVKRKLEQQLSKYENCWQTALDAARSELRHLDARRTMLLEAIPVFEKLIELGKRSEATNVKVPSVSV